MAFDPTRLQAILFDVDGTLADTDDDFIRRAGTRMHRLHFLFPKSDPTNFLRWSLMISETPLNLLAGVPDWLGVDDELARFFDWLGERRGPRTVAQPPSDSSAPAAATPAGVPLSEGAILASSAGRFVLMEGVEAMLVDLAQRYPLAIVTARGERAARGFVEQFGLAPQFRAIVSAQTAPHTKPYPDPIVWAARELKVPVESCLMVGDTTVDILAGRRAGAQTVGVLCGFGQRDELERSGASLILERTAELAGVVIVNRT